MKSAAQPSKKQAPHLIHPLLWRANSLAAGWRPSVPTGFATLDAQLPGRGWPLGSIIEVLCPVPGSVELGLIRPALYALPEHQPVALVNPPLQPLMQCFHNWHLGHRRWLWVTTENAFDALWATELLLKNNVCSALLCWAGTAPPHAIRRLQLAAQCSSTLCMLARPASTQHSSSAAHLRLLAMACRHGVQVQVLKRSGPPAFEALTLPLHFSLQNFSGFNYHGFVDQSVSAPSAAFGHQAHQNHAQAGSHPADLHA